MSDLTELTDRMRTCAATLMHNESGPVDDIKLRALEHAADLLIEASNALTMQTAEDIGEPMKLLEPAPLKFPQAVPDDPFWIAPLGELPGLKHSGTVSSRACPQCHSRASKAVYRDGKRLMLACPSCGNAWPFRSAA